MVERLEDVRGVETRDVVGVPALDRDISRDVVRSGGAATLAGSACV